MEFNTRLLHGRAVGPYAFGGTTAALAQSTSFAYRDPEALERVFAGRAAGFSYTRVANPTVAAFERRVCELEGGLAAIACASGMAAVSSALLGVLGAGDELITASNLFGGTCELFTELKQYGISVVSLPKLTAGAVEAAATARTRAVFGEIIANTSLDVADVEALADTCHRLGVPLLLDATTVTPYLMQPLSLGADIIVHSTSKYINGSGNAIGGMIVDAGRFKWDGARYPGLKDFLNCGPLAFTARLRSRLWRNLGGCMAPFNAYLSLMGMETLGLRMQRICDNALKLAGALERIDGFTVSYPALPSSPYYELVQRQFKGLGGGIINLRAGSAQRAHDLMKQLRYVSLASNLGDLRTLVIYPRATIFVSETDEEAARGGVYDDTLRVGVGIEDADDLIEDFAKAAATLKAAGGEA